MTDVTPEEEVHMSFLDHLGELRTRLMWCLVPVVPAFVVAWIYSDPLYSILATPLNSAYASKGLGTPTLHYANPADPMVAYLKQSTVVALLACSPWVFYQLWSFVAPGLYAREKRLVLPFVFASTLCFTGGGLFGWFYVLPPTFEMLISFNGKLSGGTAVIQDTLMMGEYMSFLTQMLLVFGITFEVPVVITFLSLTGMVTAKQLLGFGRWWLVVSSLLAAVLTPTQDALSMLLLLVPLVALYYVAVGIAYVVDMRRAKQAALSEAT